MTRPCGARRLHLLRDRPRQALRREPTWTTMLIPVILSGGAGTRLWPLSRELYPKQLLALTGKHTMLQETAAAPGGLDGVARPIVVCNEAHRFLVAEQLRALELEPRRHPARARRPQHRAGDRAGGARRRCAIERAMPLLLVLPADHVIRDAARFQQAARTRGRGWREHGKLVTFGIVRARAGDRLRLHPPRRRRTAPAYPHRAVRREAAARRARSSSSHRATTTGTAACSCSRRAATSPSSQRFAPDIARGVRARPSRPPRRIWISCASTQADFERCRSDSIDYAVMEKTARRRGACRSMPAGAMSARGPRCIDALPADADGNVLQRRCAGRTTRTTATCIPTAAWSPPSGIEDHVVVETKDAVLVPRRTACRT